MIYDNKLLESNPNGIIIFNYIQLLISLQPCYKSREYGAFDRLMEILFYLELLSHVNTVLIGVGLIGSTMRVSRLFIELFNPLKPVICDHFIIYDVHMHRKPYMP